MKTKIALVVGLMFAGGVQAAGWVQSGSDIYVNDGGSVGINGAPASSSALEVYQKTSAGYFGATFVSNSDTNWQGAYFIVKRTRGTKAVPTAVASGDTLGTFDFWGQASGSAKRAASIAAVVDGTVGTNVPGKIVFTTTNAAGTTAARMTLTAEGKLGLGTTSPGTYMLAVNGTIRAKELVIDTGWSDYVFDDSYNLMSLKDVSAYIEREGRLPGMPKASDVVENGIGVAEATTKLLEKVEELTLYVIQLDRENQRLKRMVETSTPAAVN